ncbi:MAG: prephenate dehydratase [Chitinispirillaceae bacterium]
MAVAFQGERGAFGELAAVLFFGKNKKVVPRKEFTDVFRAVADKQAQYGVIPIENSLAGSIHQNYDLLLENDLFIIGEIVLQVSHYLIANRGITKSKIRRVFSHPQALAQCKRYLELMKSIEIVAVSNTAAAVKKIKEEHLKDSAAIASMQAAIDYDMSVLARHIEDNRNNMTRFLILARRQKKPCSAKDIKTSIVFSTKNIPGALFKALSVFALRDIDLYKIESRPVNGKNFEYLFYLDFQGYAHDKAQKNALNHLQEITTFFRILGSYPLGDIVRPEYKKRG